MKRIVILAITIVIGACARKADVAAVPIGSDVQVTRGDGGLVEGTLTNRDASDVMIDVGAATRSIPIADITEIRLADNRGPADVPSRARFRELTVPEATTIAIRLDGSIGSASSRANDPVHGELADAVVAEGFEALPPGSRVDGVVTEAAPSGRVKGRAALALRFDRVTVGSERYAIDARVAREAAATTGSDAEKVGLPAAGGAIIGAIVGGGKGAAIGAAAGGGAGTAVVLSTPGKEIDMPAGTVLHTAVGRDVNARVPLK